MFEILKRIKTINNTILYEYIIIYIYVTLTQVKSVIPVCIETV